MSDRSAAVRSLPLVLALAAAACSAEKAPEATPPPALAPPAASSAAAAPAAGAKVDPAIPAYEKTSGVSGNLSSVGSDTMNNLMTLWGETFSRLYPNVRLQVEGKGSSTAPPALIEGTAQFGPMSRQMKPSEVDAFEKKFGYKPTEIRTSYDALAVYVHRDNPLDRLTWGDLGLTGEWGSRPISLYGRNSASGTYGFFKEHVLKNGDYKDTVKEQPGSASVVQGVTNDQYGMGYSGIGYKTSGVKAVALAEKEGAAFSSGSYDDVVSGAYPLARYLYIYVNRAPGKPLDPLVHQFLKLVLSREGQEVVVKDGYLPLTVAIVSEERGKIE
jgi:phosphate transport system substrate-binding protein